MPTKFLNSDWLSLLVGRTLLLKVERSAWDNEIGVFFVSYLYELAGL